MPESTHRNSRRAFGSMALLQSGSYQLPLRKMKTSLISERGYCFNVTTFAVAVLISLSSLIAQAADIFWTDGTASYTNTANWTGGGVPGSGDNAINTNGAGNVVQINTGNPDWTV